MPRSTPATLSFATVIPPLEVAQAELARKEAEIRLLRKLVQLALMREIENTRLSSAAEDAARA